MSDIISPKMLKFLELARTLRGVRERNFAPAETQEDVLAELMEFATMLELNVTDGDTRAARLENAAGMLATTLAFAEIVMEFVTIEELEAMIAENTESEEAA